MPAPEKLTIDTPEQIALEFPLASAGSRFLALGIDTLIQAGAFLLLLILALTATFLGAAFFSGITTWGFAVLVLAGFLVYYGYFAAFEGLWNGQTPGKRAIGLRVISASGGPLDTFGAILRNLLRIVDQLPGIYAVGVLSVFFTARNQRLGDLAANTVVVHERPVERPEAAQARAGGGARYGASRLTPQEITLMETFLQRRHALDSYLRLSTARQIVARMRQRLDLPGEAGVDEERFLEDLVAEYRRR
ncbi:MAG TPA: RDD family protein [Vicinamibacterales bacterium]|nr:RDD family protein [Vicinamibacterales bacterium]